MSASREILVVCSMMAKLGYLVGVCSYVDHKSTCLLLINSIVIGLRCFLMKATSTVGVQGQIETCLDL